MLSIIKRIVCPWGYPVSRSIKENPEHWRYSKINTSKWIEERLVNYLTGTELSITTRRNWSLVGRSKDVSLLIKNKGFIVLNSLETKSLCKAKRVFVKRHVS